MCVKEGPEGPGQYRLKLPSMVLSWTDGPLADTLVSDAPKQRRMV